MQIYTICLRILLHIDVKSWTVNSLSLNMFLVTSISSFCFAKHCTSRSKFNGNSIIAHWQNCHLVSNPGHYAPSTTGIYYISHNLHAKGCLTRFLTKISVTKILYSNVNKLTVHYLKTRRS